MEPTARRSRTPILVTGSHRSGSTWVGKMLAAAPGVGYVHEPFNISYRRPGVSDTRLTRWLEYVPPGAGGPLRDAIADTIAFRYRYAAALRSVTSVRDVARDVRDATEFAWFRLSQRRALLKDPIAIFSAEWLHSTFDADVVVAIRHPAAFVSSVRRLGWRFPFEDLVAQRMLIRDLLHPFEQQIVAASRTSLTIVEEAALLWKLIHHAIASYQERFPDWIFVRHEDLSINPLAGFEEIYSRLGLDFTSAVRSTIDRSTGDENPSARAEATPHTTKLDSRAIAFAWRKHFTRDELLRIRDLVEPYGSRYYSQAEWDI